MTWASSSGIGADDEEAEEEAEEVEEEEAEEAEEDARAHKRLLIS